MKAIDITELRQIQLNILSVIHEHCIAHNIAYSLAFGSLLGAVRHKGYIPWDDDIDLMMTRQEYETFARTFAHQYYSVLSPKSDDGYYLPFIKVCDIRTRIKEDVEYNVNFGVGIDIFPIDNVPDNNFRRNWFFLKKMILNKVHDLKVITVSPRRSAFKNNILRVSHKLLSFIPISRLLRYMDFHSRSFSDKNTKMMAIVAPSDNKLKWILPKEVYATYVMIEFEDKTVLSIKEWDKYLSAIYGDYMQMPPEDKRVTHHDFIAWWLE